jgi:putative ABC transport system permease protein
VNTWWIGIRQLRRNPYRSLLVAFGVAAASAVAVAVLMVMAGLREDLHRTVDRLGADLMVIPRGEQYAQQFNQALLTGEPARFYMPDDVVESIRGVRDVVQVTAQTYAQTLINARCCAGMFWIVGFDPRTDFTVMPWVKDPLPAHAELGADQVLVGDRILLRPGQTVNLYGTSFTVAACLEPTGTGMDWTIYATEAGLRRMAEHSPAQAEQPLRLTANTVSAIFVRAVPGTDLIDLAERIERVAPRVQAVLSSSVAAATRGQMGAVSMVLLGTAAVIWLMATVLCGIVFSQSVRERAGEIGLLLAKGADSRLILRMLAQESMLVVSLASLAGGLLGISAVALSREVLAGALGVMDVLPGALTMALLIACIGVLSTSGSVGAALIPVVHLLRSEPYEAVKQGKM